MDQFEKRLAAEIRAKRRRKKLSQEALAEKMDVATETISHFERGKTVPSVKTLFALTHELDLDVAAVFDAELNASSSQQREKNEAELRDLVRELSDADIALLVDMAKAIEKARKK